MASPRTSLPDTSLLGEDYVYWSRRNARAACQLVETPAEVVMRKLSKLIEDASDRTQWCIIGVLALLLIALIIIVFYV